jgi:hypothetical protein
MNWIAEDTKLRSVVFWNLKRKRMNKMVDIKVYRLGNVFLEIGEGELEVTVIESFYEESGEKIRRQVAKGNITTNIMDFWRCIREIAKQHKETKEIMTAIDIMIENVEEKERMTREKMRKDAEAGRKGERK